MASFKVNAQGSYITNDDRLMFVVEVRDEDGAPITGLKKSNFKIWQMCHLFGDLSFFVVELDTIAGLEGHYHLVSGFWNPAVNGTFAFKILVGKSRTKGQAMTCVVKVDGGPK
ncbi:MAG: hypothetical protein ACREO1_03315 [Arenimonas sp.]